MVKEMEFPDEMCRSIIVRVSGVMWPVGTSKSVNGAVPPIHSIVKFSHWVGKLLNQNEKAYTA